MTHNTHLLTGKRLALFLVILALAAMALALTSSPTAAAGPESCSLSIEIIAAPFAVVDSNKPGVDGPKVATLGARITNTGGSPVEDVWVHIGNGSTPGVFPSALSMLPGGRGSYYLNDLAPGASTTAYWQVRYPFTYDLTYSYTIWATAPGCSVSSTGYLTTQSEISATANKLLPTGATILTYPSAAPVGGLVNVKITGFELGTIGQGPQPLRPYDAWLQPVGNLDFDPSCLRLVRSEVKLASVTGGPVVDRLYFSGIRDYRSDPTDYVVYTFITLRSCSTVIQPYQEAASGTQEKYNGDYESGTTRISLAGGTTNSASIDLQADQSIIAAGDTVQLSATYQSNGGLLGYPDNGNPVVVTASIPEDTSYVAGSATNSLSADAQYSTDGGVTWQDNEPSDPTTVTNLRWILHEPLDSSGGVAVYQVSVDSGYDGSPVTALSEVWLLDSNAIAGDSLQLSGSATPTPTPTATPTPTPTPEVGGGEGGGLESGPLPGDPSAFLGGIGEDELKTGSADQPQANHKARLLAPMSLTLGDLLPDVGPNGTIPSQVVPVDVLATTNAPDARAVDFLDANGSVRAVALGVHTLDGPYEHDYGVCNRFKEYTFDQIEPVALTGLDPANPLETHWFWRARSSRGSGILEDAIVFHIFVDEANNLFHVDSRWIQDNYPSTLPFAFDYVFTMQVWSTDLGTSQDLLSAIMDNLYDLQGGSWQVVYHNDSQPGTPDIFIERVAYEADVVRMTVVNRTGAAQQVDLHGTWRSYVDRNTLVPLSYRLGLPAGSTILSVPLPGLLDTTIYLESSDFTDKIYTGGGLWFSFSNTPSATTAIQTEDCRNLDGVDPEDLLLAGCVTMTGSDVNGPDQVGAGRTLNPNGRPVDVSPYQALRFWAQGDGSPARVLLETQGIVDGDYYQAIVTPSTQWQQVIIPLDQFRQQGFGASVPFTGTDVKAVIWLNADPTEGSFQLSLDQVTFTNSGLLQAETLPADGPDSGPRPVLFNVPDPLAIDSMTLRYSLDDGATYDSVDMTASGNQFSAEVPGQSLGSDVYLFVEATDANGYVSRSPLDAASSFHRYRVDDRPGLLVEDFSGGWLRNRLGGGAGLFNSPSSGGQLRAYRQEGQLILDYNVSAGGQLAGYFTWLEGLNASAYTTLNLLVRGATGGEQLLVSLKDRNGYEPRLSVGDLLAGGITDQWQWVQIPLAAFAGSLDLTELSSLALSMANGYGPETGQVSLKEVRLTSLASPLVVDTFDDGNALLNGRGLSHWTSAPGSTLVASHLPGDSQYASGYALRLDYGIAPGGYALWTSELGDVSVAPGSTLSFYVKGSGAIHMTNLYLDDGLHRAYVPLADYVTPNGDWQWAEIPLQAFTAQGVNPDSLHAFQVAFEFGSGQGSLWLDQILIGEEGSPHVERRTLHLNDRDSRPVALHLPSGSGWRVTSDSWWLSAPWRGAGPANLSVRTDNLGLPAGQHTGFLNVMGEQGAQEQIRVVLTVTEVRDGRRMFLPVVGRR